MIIVFVLTVVVVVVLGMEAVNYEISGFHHLSALDIQNKIYIKLVSVQGSCDYYCCSDC